MKGVAATYISPTSFYVLGNRAVEFPTGQWLFAFCDYHGAKVVRVISAEYNGSETVITVSGDNLTTLLESVIFKKEDELQNELIWEGENEPPDWFRGIIWIDTTVTIISTTTTTTTTTTT